MEDDNVSIRLKHFMTVSELTPSVFADNCGIPRPTLSQLLNGRNKKISDVLVGMIHKAYPRLSVLWLLFGEGEMLVSEVSRDTSVMSGPEDFEFSLEFGGENSKFADGYTRNPEFSKENTVSMRGKRPYDSYMSDVYGSKNGDFLVKNRASVSEKPRSVVRITVFYDDNSYETFEPSERK